MGMHEIRAGVVGVGFVGMAHIEALRRLGVDVAGVVGSTPERAREKATPTGLAVYDSVEELSADDSIDVIHIASPNHVHADQVRTVIDAGKHVVCEKPLALTSEDSADLVSRASDTGIVNAVCFNIRFYPLNHQAMAMVRDGAIGEPRYITGSYHQDWLLRDTDWNWRLQPETGGELRALADIGSHWLDLAQFISGMPITSVMGDLATLVPVRRHPAGPVETFAAVDPDQELVSEEMTTDDAASILLQFGDDTKGAATISQVSAGRKNAVRYEIAGSESSLSWYSEQPEVLWIGHRGRPNEILHRDPSLVAEDAAATIGYPGGHVEGFPDTFRALFQKVYAAIASGGPPDRPDYPTFQAGHDAMLVTDAVAESSRGQRWVEVKRR